MSEIEEFPACCGQYFVRQYQIGIFLHSTIPIFEESCSWKLVPLDCVVKLRTCIQKAMAYKGFADPKPEGFVKLSIEEFKFDSDRK